MIIRARARRTLVTHKLTIQKIKKNKKIGCRSDLDQGWWSDSDRRRTANGVLPFVFGLHILTTRQGRPTGRNFWTTKNFFPSALLAWRIFLSPSRPQRGATSTPANFLWEQNWRYSKPCNRYLKSRNRVFQISQYHDPWPTSSRRRSLCSLAAGRGRSCESSQKLTSQRSD